MRVAVVGGRDRNDFGFIKGVLDAFVKQDDVIVSGGAVGVDSFAEEYARKRGIKTSVFRPTYDNPSIVKPELARNKMIVIDSDIVLAFPADNSKGTWNTIQHAKLAGKRFIVF